MQQKWFKKGQDVFGCGIGISTGEVLIGTIGKKIDYTIIGDNVNLVARGEKLIRTYGTKILLTEFTKKYLEKIITGGSIGHFELKALEAVEVKGKEKEARIFGLKSLPHEKTQPA
jgi:adenylate cyclase